MQSESERGIDSCLRVGEPLDRGNAIRIIVDGSWINAYEGESIAAALMASGIRCLRRSPLRGSPRGVFCGMGLCFDCVVEADGSDFVRACMSPVTEGMRIRTIRAPGDPRLDD